MKISPIHAEDLAEVGQFLHDNLNSRFSAERWISSLTHRWANISPNHGMQLRDGDRLVGVFCAIYSDQVILGKLERFCNPHSWCVLESHRRYGIGLVLGIVKQTGYHFTMFTPNPKVTEVFLGLKFKNLDDRQYRCVNVPGFAALRSEAFIESRRDFIAARLHGQDRLDFEAHQSIPWLNFAAFGVGDNVCWVIYKPSYWKHLPAAWIMYVSDAAMFRRHHGLLRSHLLLKHRMVTMKVEARWLISAPVFAWNEPRTQPKLFLSKTLEHGQIRDLYSELMSLDV